MIETPLRAPLIFVLLVGCSDAGGDVAVDESSSGPSSGDATIDGSSTGPNGSTSADGGTSSDDTTSTDGSTDAEDTTATTGAGNGVPHANDDVLYTRQDEPLVVDAASGVLGNDTDPEDHLLTVIAADALSTQGGTVVVEPDGGLTYTPAAGFWGPDSFGYTISDDTDSDAATVTIYVAPQLIPLADVADGRGGFVLDGGIAEGVGFSVSDAGDVNGDGLADLIVGAPNAGPNGPYSGRIYVVFGKADTDAVSLTDVAEGDGGFMLDGEASDDVAGGSVSSAGDVNGDGLADLIVGAEYSDHAGTNAGRSYVVLGKTDTDPVLLEDVAAGDGGFALDAEVAYDLVGGWVSGAGDVNGDSLADLVVGARGADPNGIASGRIYVVFGKADTDAVQLSDVRMGNGGFALEGEGENDQAGAYVSGAGDVNGDGLADVIVGAPNLQGAGFYPGRSYVVFGKLDTDSMQLADIASGDGGFSIEGASEGDGSGRSVRGAGDVNADGLADVILSSTFASSPNGQATGQSYVVFGKADTDTVLLADVVAGVGGFALDGEAVLDNSGDSVSGAGDVNADGVDDVIVGASRHVAGDESGRSYVAYGEMDPGGIDLRDISMGIGGFALDGAAAHHWSGYSVSGAGDVNGDGVADIIIGSPGDYDFVPTGRAYVVFGVPTAPR